MKFISSILDSIRQLSANTGVWIKAIVLIIVLGGTFTIGAVYFSKTKVKTQDCSFYISQNKELLDALIGIKKDISAVSNTSYLMDNNSTVMMWYAAYDSAPRKRQTQQQMKLQKVVGKIDSIIMRMQQQMQQQQKKS